jgi:hypothetical protein
MQSTGKSVVIFAILTLGSTSTILSAETTEYWLPVPILYADDSGVTDAVQEECGLASDLPIYIENKVHRRIKVFRTPSSPDAVERAKEKVLVLEFSAIIAPPGGSYSGKKGVTVRGELREHGEIIASFEARRRTVGHILVAGVGEGTCSMLDKCALKLAKDIAKWLKNPTMDAKLGELR